MRHLELRTEKYPICLPPAVRLYKIITQWPKATIAIMATGPPQHPEEAQADPVSSSERRKLGHSGSVCMYSANTLSPSLGR